MTVGVTPKAASLLVGTAALCEGRVGPNSIWSVLHENCHRLFPDEMFADLFADTGRRSVPPMIVAVVMVLQRLFGLSDREAVEAFCFDARWKYACGGLDFDYPGFAHTVLVDMRARLAASADPDRIFDVSVEAAREAGLVGVRRVLDSTPLYDAVATMDTITLIRSAIRAVLGEAEPALEMVLRAALRSGDDYASAAKPIIDWDDAGARASLIDSRAKDAFAILGILDGMELQPVLAQAGRLLATVVGQDLEEGDDQIFRIARRVAPDRVISTVDPEARHGHKTAARGFDGFKGHASIDPDSEIIVASTVTAGNVGDATAAPELLAELIEEVRPEQLPRPLSPIEALGEVFGDAAYGTGPLLAEMAAAGIEANLKVQPPQAPDGHYTKDRFDIDLEHDTVTCPNGVTVAISWTNRAGGQARFGAACATCLLASSCTSSPKGRVINVNNYEAELAAARARQADPAWREKYRATRPKVERKLAHLMRRRHGGRRARVRGRTKVGADFNLLAAATNFARLAVLGLRRTAAGTWAVA